MTATATPGEQLLDLGACAESIAWLDRDGHATLADAWQTCTRGDWLLWLAARINVDPRVVVRAACACARLALVHAPTGESRPLRAIETAEAWCIDAAHIDDVRQAADAADAFARATAAGYAAAYAADADADAAAGYACAAAGYAAAAAYATDAAAATYAADVADAARDRMLAQCAEIVRHAIPWTAVADAMRGAS